MTYKEFKSWCFEHGYEILECENDIYVSYHETLIAWVRTSCELVVNLISPCGHEEVAKKIVELAFTPLDKREEPKRYYVKIVDREDGYINKTSSGELLLLNRSQRSRYQTKFTEEEIKAIDERYMAFAMEVEE